MNRRVWLKILGTLIIVLVGVALYPLLAPTHYDGWPTVTIQLAASEGGIPSPIRYLCLSAEGESQLLSGRGDWIAASDLWRMSKPVESAAPDAITIRSWFGGQESLLGKTYVQHSRVLLLFQEGGTINACVVPLPDFRQTTTVKYDLSVSRFHPTQSQEEKQP